MEDIRIETYKEIEDRDIKIDREYYEKLKTINYSDVETTLEKTLEKYIKESREPIYIGAKDIALLLVILQDPILYKKLLSKEDSNLSYDIKWAKYIIFEEDNGGDFIPYVNPLINKFGKDELLAFVLFSSNYLDYNDKKVIFEGSTKLYLNLLDIKNNDKILILEDKDLDSSFLIESSFKNSNITIYSNKKSSDIDISLIPEVYNNIELELLTDERGRPKSNFEYLKARVEQKEKLDKILLAPSLTFEYSKNDEEKYRNMIQNDFNFQNEILEKTSLEWLFNLLTINHLKDDGRALSVVKINTLSNPKNKNVRKYFIENGYIESIILLPENILIGSSVSLALIVFSKGNKKIRFVDASNFYTKERRKKGDRLNPTKKILEENNIRDIFKFLNSDDNSEISISKGIEEFSENDYNLDVIENIEVIPEFENSKKIKELIDKKIIKDIIRGSQISLDELKDLRSHEETPYIYLTLSNINDGFIEYENIEDYLKKIPEKQEKFCIKNNVFLISKIGNPPYKFVVAQIPENRKIIASGNFAIIEVNEKKLNPWYLAAFFTTDIGVKVLKKAYIGVNFSSLSIKKLEEIAIPVPSIEEQNRIAQRYIDAITEIKNMKKDLKDKIQAVKEVFFEK
ncbi:N-6 DNA methylase [Fusobacterium periodonticum]|uniref:site-specific DNA-methyltransferase (adenine-specific) n=1 Tax=Fusobacterium periodonticum 1_1_41FAA TaxID=469621 RepID=D6LIW2_9FUSO|nr:N-6 DNA methylase [Fusobacterium periodonticum]EFG28338.1 N-6 DNA Methylase [Fusobacterium periodonticum 1_1_41FAA]